MREEIRQRPTSVYPKVTKMSEQPETKDLSEEEITRVMRARMPWWDWFVHDYARYWYALGAIALDIFLGLWLVDAYHLTDTAGILLVLCILVAIAAVEVLGFLRLWPPYMLIEEKH